MGAEDRYAWVRPLLAELGLVRPRSHRPGLAGVRKRVEESGLLDRMHALRERINQQARGLVVDEQLFLPPHHVLRRYSFGSNGIEHVMQISVHTSGPRVDFFSQDRNGRRYSYVRYLYHRDSGDLRSDMKLSFALDSVRVGEDDLRRWFSYLLWGLQPKFKPAARTLIAPLLDPPYAIPIN